MKKDLQKLVTEAFDDSKSAKDVIAEVKDYSIKNNLTEQEIVSIVSDFCFMQFILPSMIF